MHGVGIFIFDALLLHPKLLGHQFFNPLRLAVDPLQVWPRRLIVVVLGSPDRFNEAVALLQRGWTQFDTWSAQGRPMGDAKNEL